MPRTSISMAVALAAALLSGCAHHTRMLAENDVVQISGRSTAGLNQREATQHDLVLAAKVTVDHGFRYFRIVGENGASALQPGAGFSIKLTTDDDGAGAGLLDAEEILVKGPQSGTH